MFSIKEYAEPEASLVEVFADVGHAGSDGQALAEGSSGDVDEVQSWSRVTLEVAIQLPQVHQILRGEKPSLGPS